MRSIGIVVMLACACVLAPVARAEQTVYVGGPSPARVAALDIGDAGALSAVSDSPFAAANGASALALTPDGGLLYVSNSAAGSISGYNVGADGGLVPLPGSPYGTPGTPRGIAVTPDGRRAYVASSSADAVAAFDIGADGALTAVPGSPFPAGDSPLGVAVSPDGGRLYAANQGAGTISGFAIATDGSLSALAGAPAATSSPPSGLAFTPSGSRLYVAATNSGLISTQGFVFGFDVGADGSLTPAQGSPFPAGNGTNAIAVSSNGLHLAVTNDGSNSVSSFAIGADGALTPAPGGATPTGTRPRGLAITPDGSRVYVAGDNGNLLFPSMVVSGYSVGAGGALSAIGGSPFNPALSGSGELANVATTPNLPPRAQFSVNVEPPRFPSTFDATGSSDSDGTIARYDWDFGDGTTLVDGGPTPSHTYMALGNYEVTLTVYDDLGCSTTGIYTGQTAACGGTPAARQVQIADLDPPRITVGGDRVQRLGRAVEVRVSADEAVLAIGRGKLVVRTIEQRKGERVRGSVRRFRLRPGSVVLESGKPGSLRFRLPNRGLRLARNALEGGGRVSANINVAVYDRAENEDVQTIRLGLRAR
jgi:DNA-binding beta-propeller fold protein YncE